MPSVTIILSDTPAGGVSLHTDYRPAIGNPCSRAQSAALDIISRSRKEFGLPDPTTASTTVATVPARGDGVDIDAVHRSRDNVVPHIGV